MSCGEWRPHISTNRYFSFYVRTYCPSAGTTRVCSLSVTISEREGSKKGEAPLYPGLDWRRVVEDTVVLGCLMLPTDETSRRSPATGVSVISVCKTEDTVAARHRQSLKGFGVGVYFVDCVKSVDVGHLQLEGCLFVYSGFGRQLGAVARDSLADLSGE